MAGASRSLELTKTGDHIFSMVVTSVTGCTSAAVTKTVKIYPKLEVTLPKDYTFKCNDLDTTLTPNIVGGTPAFKYKWTTASKDFRFLPNDSNSFVNITIGGKVDESYNLKVTDSKGCFAESSIKISDPLKGSIVTTGYCEIGDSISFKSRITSQVWGIKNFKWVFDDQTFETVKLDSLFHKYGNADAVYKPYLFVEDNTGCKDTLREGASIGVIHFLPDNELLVTPNDTLCAFEKLNYSGPNGPYIKNYKFDFGEGSPISSASKSGTFTYKKANNYLLKVTIDYNEGKCKRNLIPKAVKVFPLPIVNISKIGPGCKDSLMKFDAVQTPSEGGKGIKTYSWKITNNGTNIESSSIKNPQFYFSKKGENRAMLTVTDSNNCVSGDTSNFKIYFIPKPATVIVGHCVNSNITFANNSSTRTRDDDVETNNTWWDMGNGDKYNLYNVIGHHYERTGVYNVTLTLYNESNTCFDSTSFKLVIDPQPIAAFGHDSACFGKEIHFMDQSKVDTVEGYRSPLTKRYWQFDQTNPNEFDTVNVNPIFTYKSSGSKIASLIVENAKGCTDTATSIVNVLPYPIANFTVNAEDLMAGVPIEFRDSSSGDPRPNYWYYSFGDGEASNDSTIASPIHTFKASNIGAVNSSDLQVTQSGGLYNVKQIVKNYFGCSDTITKALDLNAYLAVPNAFSPNGDNMNDKFDIIQKGVVEISDFKVFNRWGEEIFVAGSKDLKSFWDGTYKGEDQPAGVYVYYISAKSIYGGDMILKGNLTLLR
jgi:gliding motility-associated-like protein